MGRIELKKKKRAPILGANHNRARRGWASFWQRNRMTIFQSFLVGLCLFAMVWPVWVDYHTGVMRMAWEKLYARGIDISKQQGLIVQEILVDGRHFTDTDILLKTLGIKSGMPIMALDLDTAQGELLSLPWVAEAKVERRLPGTIFIHLIERQPLAIWQNKGILNVIDRTGAVILDQDAKNFSGLMVVVGADAPSFAKELVDIIQASEELQSRAQSAVRIGQRRWDVHLKNDMIVKLPENNPRLAVQKLMDMQAANKILDQDYATIDLRLPDRMYLLPKTTKSAPSDRPATAGDKTT